MVNPDTLLLEYASHEQRQSIYSLRLRPEQTRIELYGDCALEVEYKMRISANVHDLYAYGQIEAQRMQATG
jgi:hypothetical protein